MSEIKLALILLITLLVTAFIATGISSGEQQYNAFTGKWETVPDNSKYELKYNSFDGTHSYQDPQAQLEYNALQGTFDWKPPANKPKSRYKSPRPKNTSP